VARAGPDGVTHRAVAAEAGVPLAATTYYFASRDELIAQALELAVEEELARFAAARAEVPVPTDPAGAAAALVELAARTLAADPLPVLAKYELYLAAARRPALRAAARRWTDAYRGFAQEVLATLGSPDPAADAPLLVAALDGAELEALAEDRGDAETLRAGLERLLGALTGGSGATRCATAATAGRRPR
jgi:DNA-binding transcriptional regulator YbjK